MLANLLNAGGEAIATGFQKVSRESSQYETAPYTVVAEHGDFQIRDYPTLDIVTMEDESNNSSFKMLFKYISGANEEDEKIPMTAPVYMIGDTMAFVMPEYMSDVPEPTGDGVVVDQIEAGRFATIQYSGWSNDWSEDRNEEKLRQWIAEQPEYSLLSADEEPMFATFDSPWVPGFMRRNEVMFRINE